MHFVHSLSRCTCQSRRLGLRNDCTQVSVSTSYFEMAAEESILRQQHPIIRERFTAGYLKPLEQVADLKLLLLFTGHVINNLSVHHHDEAVSHGNRVVHVVCNHDCGQIVLLDYGVGNL